MSQEHYDAVIVGGGIAGGIVAKELVKKGKRVLMLEAGVGNDFSTEGYKANVENYYTALAKVPNSPYPLNPNAPSSTVLDVERIHGTTPDTNGYFVQQGPLPFRSDYLRTLGGTTMHWLGTCLRMVPKDFKMREHYGQGVDWPICYEDLMPYYAAAEREIGVAAEVDEQSYHGIHFEDNYVFPMHKVPESYSDDYLAKRIDDTHVCMGDEDFKLNVVSTPQGRNSTPNKKYNNNEGYQPVGAVGDRFEGKRCEGNSSCIPICPVQAKYNALKTLASALKIARDTKGAEMTIKTQCVASKIHYDKDSGRINGISYKKYQSPDAPSYTLHRATAKVYVLTAHAIENAKLLLASGCANSSGELGRNLMDHPYMLSWGLYPDRAGSFRGPSSTAGIASFRDGDFRSRHAAWRIEIANWGWNFAANSPVSDVETGVDKDKLFGDKLRQQLFDRVQRQMRFGFLVEQLPRATNSVTIDPAYMDQLGNYRPVISYNIDDYTRAGMAEAKRVSDIIFDRVGIEDHTYYDPANPGYVTYEGEGYVYFGSGHYVGTHRMGFSRKDSVVDKDMRCWDHKNLYLVGCGSMPTIATSNPTLTMAALSFRAADAILRDL